MRNKFNVIQINGIRGIFFLIGAVVCLIAGFVAFPGWVMNMAWNLVSDMTGFLPKIGIVQGVLLWAIVVVSYFAFKKKGFFVEFKSAHELSGEELDAVMHRIRADRRADIITKSIMRAKELEIDARNRLDKFEASGEGSEVGSEPENITEIDKPEIVENTKNS